MGCTHSHEGGSSSSSGRTDMHPWSVESGSGSSTWDTPPDAEEIQQFYEYAVDKSRKHGRETSHEAMEARKTDGAVGHRLSVAMGRIKSVRPRMATKLSRKPGQSKSVIFNKHGSRSMSLSASFLHENSDDGPKDYFLTVDHLAALAEDLGFTDLGRDEIARMWATVPTDQNGKVGKEQFAEAVQEGPASVALRILIHKFRRGLAFGFEMPDNYDFRKPSSENYRVDNREFTQEFAHLRKNIDYAYHNNYTLERQAWQDEVIKSTIVRSSEQPAPWLVFTCGPMGVGKGYCMNWMSKHGFFPLENIVHVDPDAFKLMMPEWPRYVKQSGEESGTLCHMESSFMMEIAQWAAMERRQNIWIDGSLRNADFYEQVFEDIRARYPHYKISIMYIHADEAIIRERIKVRAERTGRNVPENLIQASLGAMDKALNKLTPLCDFVARINNSGEVPVLSAFATVDAKGSWAVLQDRFARRYDDVGDFPQFLAPLPLVQLPAKDAALFHFSGKDEDMELELRADLDAPWQHPASLKALLSNSMLKNMNLHTLHNIIESTNLNNLFDKRKSGEANIRNMMLVASPMCRVTLSSHSRKLAGIPEDAEKYCWVFPLSRERLECLEVSQEERVDPLMQFLFQGGFCYCAENGTVLSVHAISHKREEMFLQFESPEELPRSTVEKIRKRGRFHPVAVPYLRQRGATKFCWVMPDEIFGRVNVGRNYGAFVYLMEGKSRGLLFPVLSA